LKTTDPDAIKNNKHATAGSQLIAVAYSMRKEYQTTYGIKANL